MEKKEEKRNRKILSFSGLSQQGNGGLTLEN
jgi:hypothetical protein